MFSSLKLKILRPKVNCKETFQISFQVKLILTAIKDKILRYSAVPRRQSNGSHVSLRIVGSYLAKSPPNGQRTSNNIMVPFDKSLP